MFASLSQLTTGPEFAVSYLKLVRQVQVFCSRLHRHNSPYHTHPWSLNWCFIRLQHNLFNLSHDVKCASIAHAHLPAVPTTVPYSHRHFVREIVIWSWIRCTLELRLLHICRQIVGISEADCCNLERQDLRYQYLFMHLIPFVGDPQPQKAKIRGIKTHSRT